jgi:hypothetical protein
MSGIYIDRFVTKGRIYIMFSMIIVNRDAVVMGWFRNWSLGGGGEENISESR